MDLGLGLFYYTLIVLLAVILTAATCLASYLVTRNKTYRYAFAGFLFYFFDVALVFQDDFLMQRASDASVSPFFIGSPVASVLVGGGALISFWLVLCEYLEEDRPAVRWIPGAAFVLASFAVLLLAPEGNGQMFLFYSMREAMLYAMLVYLAARYIGTRDDVLRLRMRRHRALYGALWALVTCVLLENVVFLLVVDPHAIAGQRLPFFPERNFAEHLFGGAPAQTEVIDKIGRPIGASAVSNGVAITADAVIGDNEHCVAVFSIARTDGMPIEGVDTILDKSFTTVFTGAQLFRVGNTKVGPEYCFYDADPSDNSVQCIVKMTSFIGGDSFIGKIMHVELGDLATGEMTADGKTTLPSLQTVIEGSWDMSFPLNYEDASIELSAGQRTKLDGIGVAIDSVVLSPIAIVVEYTADEPLLTK